MNSNARNHEKVLFGLLVFANLLCLFYFAILAIHGRFHFDDVEMLGMTQRMSLGDFVSYMYQYRSGRFVAYGINWLIYKFILIGGKPWIIPLFFYALGILLSWAAIRTFCHKKNDVIIMLATALLFNIFVLTNFDFPQFTWLCATYGYVTFPLVLFFMAIINRKRINWYHYIILIPATLILGTKESFTPLLLLIMLFNGLHYMRESRWSIKNTWSRPQARRILFFALLMIGLLITVVAAPGNFVRLGGEEMVEYETTRSLMHIISGEAKALAMVAYFMIFNIPYLVILAAVFFHIGSTQKSSVTPIAKKTILWIIVAYFAYVVISAIPQAYLFGGFGYKRNYTHVVCATVFVIAGLSYLLGQKANANHTGIYAICSLILLCGAVAYHITIDAPTVRDYSKEYDKRIAYLTDLQNNGNKDDIYIEPLDLPYTTSIKYDIFKLVGREKNDRPVLYYIPDQLNNPRAIGDFMKDFYHFDFDIILRTDGGQHE